MSYGDSFTSRLEVIIKQPSKGLPKVIPFIASKLRPYVRHIVEQVGIEKYSTPYSGHTKLLEYLNFKNGFFVLCGGNDGFGNDPTYYLEKFRGWRGIIVEPLPIYILCQKNRSEAYVYNCAVGPSGTEGIVRFIDCNAMSFVDGSIENSHEWISRAEEVERITAKKIEVPILPVQKLIDDYFSTENRVQIDLLAIDVEGSELSVLKGLDFEKNRPRYVLVEAHTDERSKQLTDFLKTKNYSLKSKIGDADQLYA